MPFRKIVYLLTIKDYTEIPKGHYHIKKNGVKSQHATYQLGNGKILQIPGNDGKMHPISTAESDEMTVIETSTLSRCRLWNVLIGEKPIRRGSWFKYELWKYKRG